MVRTPKSIVEYPSQRFVHTSTSHPVTCLYWMPDLSVRVARIQVWAAGRQIDVALDLAAPPAGRSV